MRTWIFAIAIIGSLALFLFSVYLFLPSFASPALSFSPSTTLNVVSDDVFVKVEGSDNWENVEGQVSLKAGDWVKTSSQGRAVIKFFEGSSTEIEPDTIVCIEELLATVEGSTTISLNQQVGVTWSHVAKLFDPASSFEINTSTAAAVVRGTLIGIGIDEDGTLDVKVFDGAASVVAQGQAVLVNAGYQTTVKQGEPPPPPLEIPPPQSQLTVSLASPAWLHVLDPIGRSAGIIPPGFAINEIPFSTTAWTEGEEQTVALDEPIGGRYYLIIYAYETGPVTLTVAGNSQDGFDQQETRVFNVEKGKDYYLRLDLGVQQKLIQSLLLGDLVVVDALAGFNADKTEAAVGEAVQLTDLSRGEIASWQWNFGDGATSTEQNPSHTYAEPGIYTVTLNVSTPAGSDTEVKNSYVKVYQAPQADFTADKTVAAVSGGIQFTDTSSGEPTSWQWDFGDGATSTEQNPSHAYTNPGVYTVTLAVSNPAGSDTEAKSDYITVYQPPQADFSADKTEVAVGETVQFTDTSTGGPTSWQWDFGDGATSTEQNPSHTYANPGVYTVTLTVSNPAGSDTEAKADYIRVYQAPQASFSADKTEVAAGEAVQFTDLSTGGPTSWQWNFGDGTTSTERNPSHTYANSGVYTVTLTVSNPAGSGTEAKADHIRVYEPPQADFSADKIEATLGEVIQFTDLSTGGPTSWQWNFGDGATSTEQNPSHAYTSPGVYTVTLTVSNPAGSDTEAKADHVRVYEPPQADFSADKTEVAASETVNVQFTDLSTGEPTSWQWNFGDGAASTEQNPSHAYANPGLYTVTLMVSNPAGSDTELRVDYIKVYEPPQADFTADKTEVAAGEVIQFTDLSTGEPTSWYWNFCDGATSTEQNPSHAYANPGVYIVALWISNPAGSDIEFRVGYIKVYEPPQADFTVDKDEAAVGEVIQFTDLSTEEPTSWQWNFGDGAASTEQNPSHAYANPGVYNVTLMVSNPAGSDTEAKNDHVKVY